jgi:hypothetical protein
MTSGNNKKYMTYTKEEVKAKTLEYFKGDDLQTWDVVPISSVQQDSKSRKFVTVKCKVCNLERKAFISALKRGKGVKHGKGCTQAILSKDLIYKRLNTIYKSIDQRVNNKNNTNYKWYGGRGIKSKFSSFVDFYQKMVDSYKEALKTTMLPEIDRKDNNGNYSLDNCRWVSHQINCNNKNSTVIQRWFIAISDVGEVYLDDNQHKFAERYNLDYRKINLCLNKKRLTHKNWKFEYV